MLVFNIKAFDDYFTNAGAVYTSAELNNLLAKPDKLALMAVTDQVFGVTALTVQIEHSADGRNWVAKNGTAEIPSTLISTTATTVLTGSDSGSSPSLGFVRLKLMLPIGGPGTATHVKLYVTGRDRKS
jgi:hypothetical protein